MRLRPNLLRALVTAAIIGTVYALTNVFRIGWHWSTSVIDFTFGSLLTLFIWWYNLGGYRRLEQRLFLRPHASWSPVVRVVTTFLWTIAFVEVADAFDLFKDEWVGYEEPELADEMKALVTAAIVLLAISLFETTDKYYRARLENEQLKLENSLAQFELLRQQISPHFLFNSLNILKTLVANHSEKAEAYLVRLAEFYRALLVHHRNEQIPLADELTVLRHYLYVLEIRFEEKFRCRIDIAPRALSSRIPPFTLQMLLENALKHNIVSAEKPLDIEIFTEKGLLIVRNNFQPKRTVETGSQFGLENIDRRYRLLAERGIEIQRSERYFTVRLPLIF